MRKDRFVLGWEVDSDETLFMKSVLSNRVKAVMESHHGMWNYMTYRDAIKILGLDTEEIYKEGRVDLDPKKWADFGWMTCYVGPPKSAVKAMREQTKASNINPYSPDLINPLRDDCAEIKLKRERSKEFEVIGTEGGQAGISYALQTFINPGDEVIITDPGYFHFESAILMVRGVPVRIPLNSRNGYRLNPDEVKEHITPRTKVIIVCDPLNPFGTVQLKDELIALIEITRRHDIIIIDDITHNSQRIDPNAIHYPMSSLWREINVDNVVSTFSVSHGYGMAGIRIGFLAGHTELMRACLIAKVSLTRLNTNLIAQYGALAALREENYIRKSEYIIRRNYNHIKKTISQTNGVSIPVEPKYGFSMVVDVSGTGVTAQELTVALFKHRVAVYPGDGLGNVGATDYIRLNISRPDLWAFRHFRKVLPLAIKEARSGIYRKVVIQFFKEKKTERAKRILQQMKDMHLADEQY
ncbi:MAG TPA: pyridoxal phosphate-dependent aminotransferase [Thermodesulfobacteriota bacterium]|nr:pyridoxal phosphate-dependent aminotransferase [Thermodesulfobacteriota bacterium]